MNEKIVSFLSDPVNAKIILEIYERENITAKQLSDKFSDIPPATLYRHLRKMSDNDILRIAETNRVRGTVERVYALNLDLYEDVRKSVEANDGRAYLQIITQSILGVLREFKEYTAQADIDIINDGSGFSVAPVYATTEELKETLTKVRELLKPLYNNLPDGQRHLHNICIITTPPKNIDGENTHD